MNRNTSAASQNTTLASVRYEIQLSGMWSRKMKTRPRPRKKSSRRSRPAASEVIVLRPGASPRRRAGRTLLARLVARAEHELAEQLDDVDRRLGELDLAAGRDGLVVAAGHQRDEIAAEQALADHLRDGVGGQLDRRIDVHPHRSEERL